MRSSATSCDAELGLVVAGQEVVAVAAVGLVDDLARGCCRTPRRSRRRRSASTPASIAASSTRSVPRTFVSNIACALRRRDPDLVDRAPTWKTASQRSITAPDRDRRGEIALDQLAAQRLAAPPPCPASAPSATTSSPRSRSLRTTRPPMNPVPPVTKILMPTILAFGRWSSAGDQSSENPSPARRSIFRRTTADTGGELLELESIWEHAGARSRRRTSTRARKSSSRSSRARCRSRSTARGASLSEGDQLVVPPGTVHAMWNAGPGPVRAAWVTRPALRTEQFFERAWGLAAGPSTNASARRCWTTSATSSASPHRCVTGCAAAGPRAQAACRRPALRRLGGRPRLRGPRDRAGVAAAPRAGGLRGGAHLRLAARPLRPRRHRAARPARTLERRGGVRERARPRRLSAAR